MASVKNDIGDGSKTPFLRAGEFKLGTRIGGVVYDVRKSPSHFTVPYIVEFDTDVAPGIGAWNCNKTEARRLAMLISDDYVEWKGWAIILCVVKTALRQTQESVHGFVVESVLPPVEAAKKRTTKPLTKEQLEKRSKGPSDQQVPF